MAASLSQKLKNNSDEREVQSLKERLEKLIQELDSLEEEVENAAEDQEDNHYANGVLYGKLQSARHLLESVLGKVVLNGDP